MPSYLQQRARAMNGRPTSMWQLHPPPASFQLAFRITYPAVQTTKLLVDLFPLFSLFLLPLPSFSQPHSPTSSTDPSYSPTPTFLWPTISEGLSRKKLTRYYWKYATLWTLMTVCCCLVGRSVNFLKRQESFTFMLYLKSVYPKNGRKVI